MGYLKDIQSKEENIMAKKNEENQSRISEKSKDIEFTMKIKKIISGLDLQRVRIFNYSTKIHDVDYYTILLRRAYRIIEYYATKDSRVANLKGKNKNLLKKIKLRDHFEHEVKSESRLSNKKLSDFRIVSPDSHLNINITTSIVQTNNSFSILSGDIIWDLSEDHLAFIKILDEFIKLYPFQNKHVCKKTSYKQLKNENFQLKNKVTSLEKEPVVYGKFKEP